MRKIEELIKKKQELKKLQEGIKLLEAELLQEGLQEEKVGNFMVKKVTRLSYKLKPDVDTQKILEEYPEAAEVKVNVKVLTELGLSQYLEENETEYLQVKEIKE